MINGKWWQTLSQNRKIISRCCLRTRTSTLMNGILGYTSLYTRLETITSWEPIVTGIELLWHAQVWNASSERWFIVVPWFIRSTTERSNSPGPFIFQKGWGSSSKHTAKSLIQMWYVNICKSWSSIGPMLLRQKRRAILWFGGGDWKLKWVTSVLRVCKIGWIRS